MFGPQYRTNIDSRISISKIDLTLLKKAVINGFYFDDLNGSENISEYTLTMDETNGYNDWLNNDSYLVNWVIHKICGEGVHLVE